MAVDRIKHTKPASRRTFLDELEPIPYEITEEELAKMDPRMKQILFGIAPVKEEPILEEKPESATRIQVPAPEQPAPEISVIEPEPVQPEKPDITPVLRALADGFAPAPTPHITLIFPAEEEESEIVSLARAAGAYHADLIEGRLWHAARFEKPQAETLRRLNDLLGERQGMITLANGRQVPYGRSLWLPMMFIFTTSRED